MIHELRHIRAFLKIAKTRNFTRAANDLHVSQSALTVQVQQLEESLGVRLFDRNKRGVMLTAAGKDVFGPLQRLFHDAQTIVEHARDLSSASTGFVSIAALPTVCAGPLPELVRSFLESFPGIRVQISDVIAERVREAVLKREVDFGIGTLHGRDAELRATPLFQDHLVVFTPPGHPLSEKRTVTLREASAHGLILPGRESSVREAVEAIAHRERLLLDIRYETNFMPTALAFVRANLGIAILPETAAGTDTSDFSMIPLNNRFSSRQIELLQRRDATLSPASESLVRHLLQKLHARKREDRSAASTNTRRRVKNR
ncbi:LysR family transcriptional regulator [Acidipila rosea]|uniref:DNA-binding transcriptional LysR family regulator n=1 Tax=Acidipila rosea TaxID=768535 RepID=A0A4R1LBB4_9BACT|nr:LysR family transcriptional regulator [Acidipila rosea]TCK75642.1 DNA-binding transcriptional LysR family regulator [Acidipila rosea]